MLNNVSRFKHIPSTHTKRSKKKKEENDAINSSSLGTRSKQRNEGRKSEGEEEEKNTANTTLWDEVKSLSVYEGKKEVEEERSKQ